MAGLGCGSLAGGHLADRLSPKHRLLAFGTAEAIITLFALSSKWLYYDLLYVRWSVLGASPVLLPLILFASLLIPTFCMGLTLPILAKAFTAKIEMASAVVGFLYGVNTLGAAVGALLTPWFLLRHFSFPEVLRLGAALNALCAVGAVLVWWCLGPEIPSTSARAIPPNEPRPAGALHLPARVWMLIYALSGFIALSLEIVWFRLLGVMQKSTSFTFPTLAGRVSRWTGFRRHHWRSSCETGTPSGPDFSRVAKRRHALCRGRSHLLSPPSRSAGLLSIALEISGELRPRAGRGFAERNLALVFCRTADTRVGGQRTLRPVALFWIADRAHRPINFHDGREFPGFAEARAKQSRAPRPSGRLAADDEYWRVHARRVACRLVPSGWLGSAGTFKLLVLLSGTFLCLAVWHLSRRSWIRLAGIIAAVGGVISLAAAIPTIA